jgi:single-strand DNA-binding protein
LLGFVGKDPEIKVRENGDKIAKFSLATTESWRNKQGEWQEKTEWHYVAIYNPKYAEYVSHNVKKGTKIYIEGQIQHREYVGQDGQARRSHEIVVGQPHSKLLIVEHHKSSPDTQTSVQNDQAKEYAHQRALDKFSMNRQRHPIDDSVPF